jgi:hypothetical protein
MIVLFVVALAVAGIAFRTRTRAGVPTRDGDLPQRIVAAAVNALPASRRAWGQALIAELAAVSGRGRRWRFAAASLRIALFPPAPKPAAALTTAVIGSLLTIGVTLATTWLMPTMSVFMAVLGLLLSGYATALAGRSPHFPAEPSRLAPVAVAMLGVLAAVVAVSAVAATHPAATRDETHIYSVVLALVLSGYLIAGLSMVIHVPARASVWAGVVGAIVAVAVSATIVPAQAVVAPISPVTAAATLVTTAGIAAWTGNRLAATRAGLLVAILSAPVEFAITVIAAEYADPSVLTNPYDIAAYPRSGYPDVASYLLSDTLGGNIVALVVTPLVAFPLAMGTAAMTLRMRGGRSVAR